MENIENIEKKGYRRIFELDFLRGLAIILVMFDHLLYNFAKLAVSSENSFLFEMHRFSNFYWDHPIRIVVRLIVLAVFFSVSGASSQFSASNKKRAIEMILIAYALTIVSYLGVIIFKESSMNIDFGAIHAFGFSILIYYFFQNKKDLWSILIVAFSIVFGIFVYDKRFDIGTSLLVPFGILPYSYSAADYMPLFPWLGFFFAGGLFAKKFYQQRKSLLKKEIYPKLSNPILFMGRHSLWFYFGQQVILFPVFTLIQFFI